ERAGGIRLAREMVQTTEVCANLAGLGRLEGRIGRADECRVHLTEALELADRLGLGLFRTWVYLGLTILELGLGHLEEAIHQAETAQAVLNELGIQDADLSPTPDLVEAYLRLGKVESATSPCQHHAQH